MRVEAADLSVLVEREAAVGLASHSAPGVAAAVIEAAAHREKG